MKKFEYEGSELQSIESRTFYNCKSLSLFKMKNLSYQSNYSPKEEVKGSQNNNEITRKPSYIGSLKKVVFENKSKSIKTFEFDRNSSPIYLHLNHKYTNHRNDMFPRCQTVQCKAFCKCKSLLYVRLFLGNLERFQTNAFKNYTIE